MCINCTIDNEPEEKTVEHLDCRKKKPFVIKKKIHPTTAITTDTQSMPNK